MRSRGLWAASLAVAILAALAVPASVAATRGGRPVDADGDKIFDSLDRVLDRAAPREAVGVIAVFSGGSSSRKVAEAKADVGSFDVSYEYQTLSAFAADMTPEQVRALARRPDVVQVQENAAVELAIDTAKAAAGADRAAVDFGVDGNNEQSPTCPGVRQYCKDDVVIAVLDSGIDTGHVDLDNGKVIGGTDCSSGTCTDGMWMVDANDHGTHVSSIAAGEGDGNPAMKGVAPGAALVSVRVGNSGATVAALDASLEWVLANRPTYGIEIVNMSLNGNIASDGTDTTSRLVNRLAAAGVTTFSSVGNGRPEPGSVGFPAAAKYGFGVGNMLDPIGGGPSGWGFALWMLQKRGPTLDGRIKPEIVSYGVDIMAADANTTNGYKSSSGTSMSSPFAAGVAALMLDANPTLVPSGVVCAADDLTTDCTDGVVDSSMTVPVRDLMMQTAVDWAVPGLDNETGAGRLDAYAAVDAASALTGTPSAMPTHEFVAGTVASGASVDHTFRVTDATVPFAATVIAHDRPAGATSPDLNLELLGPEGQRLAYAATESNLRQENVSALPTTTGTYTVRVISAAGDGSYWLDVSYGGGLTEPSPTPTPVPPDAPANLTAAAVSGSTSQIDLKWSDVAGETGYKVERSPDGLSGWTQIGTTAADVVTYRDAGLAAATTYHYRVKAYNDAGDSIPSNVASAKTNSGDTTAPTTPTSVKASGGRGKISLSWKASTDTGGSGLAGYKVFRSTSSTGTFVQIATTTTTGYTDTAVVKATTYWYYVVAYDKAGNHSAPSSKVSAKAT
ncbi:MAG TPA: S8 family serine peptidase [Actinomycetota bacterium]|nr:S8 family serine peptidase [Actinomycetota bacterium]